MTKPSAEFQVIGYFYVHNRLPSALFNTIEEAEDSAEQLTYSATRAITFYRIAKFIESKLTIDYIHHWPATE